MTLPIDYLGLHANSWKFLAKPEKYSELESASGECLVPETTARQFRTAAEILARLNGSQGRPAQRGLLLADDVGLGKTAIAALVAWIVARAGGKRTVRILAPNDVMARSWEKELQSHVPRLNCVAAHLDVRKDYIRTTQVKRLNPGFIHVAKHSHASSDLNLTCDLLIVDEAHRAKGDQSAFSHALRRQKKHARRVLILTATPFSIRLAELTRMLDLVGGEAARVAVGAYSRALDDLYAGDATRDPEVVADKLVDKATAAIEALRPHCIRHGVDDLHEEKKRLGSRQDWPMEVPAATAAEVETLLRMDRALRLASRAEGVSDGRRTNDPRFHVGWRHFRVECDRLADEAPLLDAATQSVIGKHREAIMASLDACPAHRKMEAVGSAVRRLLAEGEKVLLFCHHHATAQELTAYLGGVTDVPVVDEASDQAEWRAAWNEVLQADETYDPEGRLLKMLVDWLSGDAIWRQVQSWLFRAGQVPQPTGAVFDATGARHPSNPETIGAAARRLYAELMESRSSREVLRAAQDINSGLLGAAGRQCVWGLCDPSPIEGEAAFFLHQRQPDTAIILFNSPFGANVLVTTDKLSEGVSLHRYCRHLIHYELDPSPIRTVQRNGRVRRVNSWGAVTGKPVLYAYPAFSGTRDQRLVEIMKRRVDCFSILMGGVQEFDVDVVDGVEEGWRNRVVEIAKGRLRKVGRSLRL